MIKEYINSINTKNTNDIIKSLGLVFGDIGTSPIYTLTVIFILTKPTESHVIGILSLIIWTLITIVTIQYAWLAMSLGQKGEGGTIVLKEILAPMLKSKYKLQATILLTYIGVSLLFGDGVITPAISILSAVEGLILVPGLENTGQGTLVFIAAIIAIVLFSIQKKGTDKIAWAFGPLMIIWFLSISIFGIISIIYNPIVLKAIFPYYGIKYLLDNGIVGFLLLSQIILCATGGEALYADMGHLGKEPIIKAWRLVFVALSLSYLGQGAFIIQHPEAKNILFEMVFSQIQILYVPFLIISIMATIIASQAMISGMFSIVYQGITTRILPMLKIDYTSDELKSQIYIGVANWTLLLSVLFVLFIFRRSEYLAEAYGLAVTGTMAITGILMTYIFYLKGKRLETVVSILITIVDLTFLLSSFHKIPYGGYWSIILAIIPFGIITIYTTGQKRLAKSLKPMDYDIFIEKYREQYKRLHKIKGTALFFVRDIRKIPSYIANTIIHNDIIYEDNVMVSIIILEEPYGLSSHFIHSDTDGLRIFEIKSGYNEVINIEKILKSAKINERIMFYGIEDIVTENIIWKIYSTIKKLAPAFVQFYELPSHKIHGIITRIEM